MDSQPDFNVELPTSESVVLPWRKRRNAAFVFAIVMLFALLSWWSGTRPVADRQTLNQLEHWQDARHDWLLVVDQSTRELVVYDALDGRPLKRLGAGDGFPGVHAIVRQGAWLYVMGRRQSNVRLLKLPELREVAFDRR